METVKGFKDFIGEEAARKAEIKRIMAEAFERYGFDPAETPIVEQRDFVVGENKEDDAVRDVFKLQDRGKRNLALRYEFTFQLKRLAKNKKLPYKRYQIGELFRDEPIREGRTRQFTQCDVDVIGSTTRDEAECLAAFNDAFKKLNVKVDFYFNNRKLLNEIFIEQGIKDKEQVLREIDKLDKLSENEVKKNLKKYKAEKLLSVIKKPEKYFEKYSAYKEIKELKEYCKLFGVEATFRPFMVRGLSYYNGSVFEVWSKKLKVSVCGGGSYLVNGIQSTGISVGLEPLLLLTKGFETKKEKYLVISLGQDREAIKLAEKLRAKGEATSIFYGKPSKALEYANSYGFSKAVFVGEKEVKSKKFKVKNLKSGKENTLNL